MTTDVSLLDTPPTRGQALLAALRAWRPLFVYEVLVSLVSTTLLGPLAVAASYQVIGLSGEGVIGNEDLARFFVSPLGLLSIVLGASVALGILFLEYSGLILLTDAALRRAPMRARDVAMRILGAGPRIYGLAVVQTLVVLAGALPFVAVGGLTYWLLLSGTDINFYLAERPPRFWAALGVGLALALGAAVGGAWLFCRWGFALPACVLDGEAARSALRTGARLGKGRARLLLPTIVAWTLLRSAALLAAIPQLDRLNDAVLARFEGRLDAMLGSAFAMLLVDAFVLQVLSAAFAIALAVGLTIEYRRARPASAGPAMAPAGDWPGSGRRTRRAVLAVVAFGPVASLVSAVVLVREFVVDRPTFVTAHRAGPKSAPENSLAALRLSIEAGADFAEIDVQQTADGHLVLLHDRDLMRVAGLRRDIADVTLADLADARLRLNGRATDEPVPTLEQCIAACGDSMRLNVELKDYGRENGLAQAVVDVLREQGFTDRAIACCLKLPPLQELKRIEPTLPVGLVLSVSRGDLSRLPVDFLSLQHLKIRADTVRRAHRRGLDVHAWTVSDRPTALRMLDLGVDNLITDDPALMREVVDWHAGLNDAERILLRLRRWMRE